MTSTQENKPRASSWSTKDRIDSGVSILGAILVLVGLLFTGCQIRQGAIQLEAANIYTMQKDGRELFEKTVADEEFVEVIFNYDPSKAYDAATLSKVTRKVGVIMQFYSSIFRQHSYGAIGNDAWNIAEADLCGFVNRDAVGKIWQERLAPGFSEEFRNVVDACLA